MISDGVPCEFIEPKNDGVYISENATTNSINAAADNKTASQSDVTLQN